jgi:SSS family solute:Na+ symporter
MIAFLSAFIIYTLVLIGIGIYGYQQTKKAVSFGMGDRTINYWITALSAHAADMSIWLFFGLPSAIYLTGIEGCWIVLGLLGGMWATWHFIAPRLRTASEATHSTTLTNFLCTTAGDTKGYLTIVSSCLLVFFFLFYIAVCLNGIGKILTIAFGAPYWLGVVLSALVVTIYISLGGYMTVALTDAFQAIFLLFMIIIVPLFTAWNLYLSDGFAVSTSLAQTFKFTNSSLSIGLANALNWGLGYLGMPHILTKFMSIDSVKNMKKGQYVGLSFQAITLGSAMAIGILAHFYFLIPPASKEQLFSQMVLGQFTPLLAGLILCAVMAATLSTLDAQLITCASVIARDLCKATTEIQERRITQLSTALIAAIATTMALTSASSIHEIVEYAWSGLGSTFGPLMIMSLFAPQRLTSTKALAGIIVGGGIAALWPYYGPIIPNLPLIPGFCSGLLVMYGYSKKYPHIY